MAAITPTIKKFALVDGAQIRFSGTGTANQGDTLTTAGLGGRMRFRWATVAYSGVPVQTGVTVTLDSGAGSSFDCTLYTGTANAQYSFIIPEGELWICPEDAIVISAPAGGGTLTASILILMEGG